MKQYNKLPTYIYSRLHVFRLLVLCAFFVLTLRLWHLQLVRGEYFRDRSENNRLRTAHISAPRGVIFDRKGRTLVKNRPAFNVGFISEDSQKPEETLETLAEVLEVDLEVLQTAFKDEKSGQGRFEAISLMEDVTREQLARIKANQYRLPGIKIGVQPRRVYENKEIGAHVLGYIREVTEKQLRDPKFATYRARDLVGQYGVEKVNEYYLQGTRGVRRLVVDARGRNIGEASFESERAGHQIYLTIDLKVQKKAEQALGDRKGVIVLMDVKTGEVLSLVSKPAFDPNVFAGSLSSSDWNSLVFSPDKPLTNRVAQGVYPPGSLFKVITAISALSEGVVSPTEKIHCPGHFRIGKSRPFHCHKRTGHGSLNISEAIRSSCNVFFYTIGQRVGVDRLHDYATQFGLGKETGLVLADEAKGLVPSREWKKNFFKNKEDQKWFPGETPSVSIGQGAVGVTPIQIAKLYSAIANKGNIVTPFLVKKILTSSKDVTLEEFSPNPIFEVSGIDAWIFDSIRSSLYHVVNANRGTGKLAQLPEELPYKVAGKTGTAQLRSISQKDKKDKDLHIAWFAGFAPYDEPEVAVVVLVEEALSGGKDSAPIASKVLEAYFNRNKKEVDKKPIEEDLKK